MEVLLRNLIAPRTSSLIWIAFSTIDAITSGSYPVYVDYIGFSNTTLTSVPNHTNVWHIKESTDMYHW